MVCAGDVPGHEADEQAQYHDAGADADGEWHLPALAGGGRPLLGGRFLHRRLVFLRGRLVFGRFRRHGLLVRLGRLPFGFHLGKGRGVLRHTTT